MTDKVFKDFVRRTYKCSYKEYDIRNKFLEYMYESFYSNNDFRKYFNLSILNVNNIYSPKASDHNFVIKDYINSFNCYSWKVCSNDYILNLNITDKLRSLNIDKLNKVVNSLYRIVFNNIVKYAYAKVAKDIRIMFNAKNVKLDKIFDKVDCSRFFKSFNKRHDDPHYYMPFVVFNMKDIIDFRTGKNVIYERGYKIKDCLSNTRSSIGYDIFNNQLCRSNVFITDSAKLDFNKPYNSKFMLDYIAAHIMDNTYLSVYYQKDMEFTNFINNLDEERKYIPYTLSSLMPMFSFTKHCVIGNIINNLVITIEHEDGKRNFIMYDTYGNTSSNIVNRSSFPIYKSLRASPYINGTYGKLKPTVKDPNVNNHYTKILNSFDILFREYNKFVYDILIAINKDIKLLTNDESCNRFTLNIDTNTDFESWFEKKLLSRGNYGVNMDIESLYKFVNNNLKNGGEFKHNIGKLIDSVIHNFYAYRISSSSEYFDVGIINKTKTSYNTITPKLLNSITQSTQTINYHNQFTYNFDLFHAFMPKALTDNLESLKEYSLNLISYSEDFDDQIKSFVDKVTAIFNHYLPINNNPVFNETLLPYHNNFIDSVNNLTKYKHKISVDNRSIFNSSIDVIGDVPEIESIVNQINFIDHTVDFRINHMC